MARSAARGAVLLGWLVGGLVRAQGVAPPQPVGPLPAQGDVVAPDAPRPQEFPPALPVPPAPRPPPAERARDGAITVRAQRVVLDRRTGHLRAEGGVTVLAPDRTLSAGTVDLDVHSGQLTAEGPLVMADSRQVVTCQHARLDLRNRTGQLQHVRLETREPMDEATRRAVVLLGKAPPGRRMVLAVGESVELHSPESLRIDGAYLTTCDCAQGPAPWSVKAHHADVTVGERALVWAPVVQVLDVPVLPLPLWVVPLGGRQSGFLFPEVRFQDGLWLAQPLYLTAGDSADITLSPGVVAQRGPRLAVEARARPAEETAGEVNVVYQQDRKHLLRGTREDGGLDLPAPVGRQLSLAPSRTDRGEVLSPDRFSARLVLRSRVGRGSAAAEINLASDKDVPGDFGASLGDRVAPYLRSAAAFGVVVSHLTLSASVVGYQDLQQPNVALYGTRVATLGHRIPALRLHLAEMPLVALPVVGTLLAARARLGMDREWLLGGDTDRSATRERLDDPGRMAGALRLFAQPELVVPLRLSRWAGLRTSLSLREAVLAAPDGRVADVTRLVLGSQLETEVTGRFRSPWTHGLTHRVRPYVAYQGVLFERRRGEGAWPWLDVEDRAGRAHAVGGGLNSELVSGKVLGRVARWTVDVRGAADLLDPRRQELLGRSAFSAGDVSTSLRMALDPPGHDVTFLQGSLDVGGGRRPRVHAGYTRVGAHPPRFMLASGEELLGGVRWNGPEHPGASDRLDALLAVPVGPLVLDYGFEAAFPGMEFRTENLSTPRSQVGKPELLTHGGGVVLESECHCWQAGARLRFWPHRALPDAAVQVSLQGPDGPLNLMR